MSGSHTTAIQAAVLVVETARGLKEVSKVVLGKITSIKGNSVVKSLKITVIDAGLSVKVRGPNSVQQLYVYTSDPLGTEQAIRAIF